MLDGVRCAVVLLGPADEGPYAPVAVWPDAKLRMHHLTGAAERALKERRGIMVENPAESGDDNPYGEAWQIAYPIEVSGRLHGVVALGAASRPREDLQRIMRSLHWGAAWLEVLVRRTEETRQAAVAGRMETALDLMASAVEHQKAHAAGMALATRMADRLGCDRVSLGFTKGRRTRVRALSHSAEAGERSNLMRAVGAAMDEAVDQRAAVAYPLPEDGFPFVVRDHEALSRRFGAGAVLTVPFRYEGEIIGAVTLERDKDHPFDSDTIDLCETVANLAGPMLHEKRREERWLITKAAESTGRQFARLLGPRHPLRKLAALLVAAIVVFFYYYEVDYRITVPTVIEGAVRQVVAAPYDGYVKTSSARPGDVVRAGQVLCHLDDRELTLDRVRWTTEAAQLAKQHQQALAEHDRARIRILRARMDQAQARIALIEEQLARVAVKAPFDGVIMSGDLTQSLGAPVERGQVLFEVAPLGAYRVVAEVDERDIDDVTEGQQSELVLPSMPGRPIPFTISRVTPVSVAEEGRNHFRVEGEPGEGADRLRPGMEGVGKITVDRRRLIWVWTHDMIDWLRLKLWRWMP
jgi:RND family efflux transporter MFP subunit